MTHNKVIFSGASITNSPWYTWKDFVQHRYGLTDLIYNDYKGVGNEFIVESTIYKCQKNPVSTALVMLTNFDKWDWFVGNPDIANCINEQEKHPVRGPDGEISLQGYWSTGSWFPKYKEYFLQNYYSSNYFIKKSLKELYILQKFFQENKIQNLILFDSPIFDCAEQTLNTGIVDRLSSIQQNDTLHHWISLIDWTRIYQPGLIGFCVENHLDWYNSKHKGHPPSLSHLEFSKKHIFPYLDKIFPVLEQNQDWMSAKMDKLWHV
jgi:hypothetical protein